MNETAQAKNKNLLISILLAGIFITVIAIFIVQIFHPFGGTGKDNPNANNTPITNYNPNDDKYGDFDENDLDGGKQDEIPAGGVVRRYLPDGTPEYSADGGKTWSKTHPYGGGSGGTNRDPGDQPNVHR